MAKALKVRLKSSSRCYSQMLFSTQMIRLVLDLLKYRTSHNIFLFGNSIFTPLIAIVFVRLFFCLLAKR